MPIRVSLVHRTYYTYDIPVYLSAHSFRLKPAAHSFLQPESYSLTISPENHSLHWHQDPFGNFVARVDFTGTLNTMSAEVKFTVEWKDRDPFDFFLEDYAQVFPFIYENSLEKALYPYFELTEESSLLSDLVTGVMERQGSGIIEFLVRLNKEVNQRIAYTIRMEPGIQSCEQSLALASGSCRDSAWLLVQILRRMHLAARFVSGYLLETGDHADDRLSLHAWTEVYLPGAGWIGLDPSSGLFAGAGHIPLAATPEPDSAAPVSGTTGQCRSTLNFMSEVIRLNGTNNDN